MTEGTVCSIGIQYVTELVTQPLPRDIYNQFAIALNEGFSPGFDRKIERGGEPDCPEQTRRVLPEAVIAHGADGSLSQVMVSVQRVYEFNLCPFDFSLCQPYSDGIDSEISITEVFFDTAAKRGEIEMPSTFRLGKNHPGYLINLIQRYHPASEILGNL